MPRYRWFSLLLLLCTFGILWELYHISWDAQKIYQEDDNFVPSIRHTDNGSIPAGSAVSLMLPSDEPYEFLYGEEFQKALDRAEKNPKKVILFWHPDGDYSMTFSKDLPRECGSCLVRDDKKLINDKRTEAVIILFDYTVPRQRPKVKRNPNQYWIWRCAEAPPYMRRGGWLSMADEMKFNKTLTYRLDSDFIIRYGDTFKETGTGIQNPLANKKHLILIAVSNCGMTPGATVRMKYLQELKKNGLRINLLGRCFRDTHVGRGDVKGMLEYTSQHKFYFAFENAYHCKDYVTEKFFRAIQAGVVPVVWGATKKAYELYIPSSGFIFLEDFPTMQSFINYLNYLDKNDTAYLEYFRWRTERLHHPHYKQETSVCEICRFLHGINVDDAYKVDYQDLKRNQSFISDGPKPKMASSIKEWWDQNDNPECYANFELDENGRIVVV